jgi:hypothetical protein
MLLSTFCQTLHVCVLYVSKNKERLLPYTKLTISYNEDGVFTARYELNLEFWLVSVLKRLMKNHAMWETDDNS